MNILKRTAFLLVILMLAAPLLSCDDQSHNQGAQSNQTSHFNKPAPPVIENQGAESIPYYFHESKNKYLTYQDNVAVKPDSERVFNLLEAEYPERDIKRSVSHVYAVPSNDDSTELWFASYYHVTDTEDGQYTVKGFYQDFIRLDKDEVENVKTMTFVNPTYLILDKVEGSRTLDK